MNGLDILAVILGLFVGWVIWGYINPEVKQPTNTQLIEQGYFQGQLDALHGVIRIRKIDSCYVWDTWPNGVAPEFNPNDQCAKYF